MTANRNKARFIESLIVLSSLMNTLASVRVLADDSEFPSLSQRASKTNRLHIISEITQNNQRIQVEEFVDFNSFSQLVQLRWHETGFSISDDRLKTKKINLLVLNGNLVNDLYNSSSFLYIYEPFKCELLTLNGDDTVDRVEDWSSLLLSMDAKGNQLNQSVLLDNLIKSIKSTSYNSPYVVSFERKSEERPAHLMGVAGLWLQATSRRGPLERSDNSSAWRMPWLSLDSHLLVNYFLSSSALPKISSPLKPSLSKSNAEYDLLNLIELRNARGDEGLQLINVIDTDFHFSNRLARDLFSLPIGFYCAENPLLDKSTVYLDSLEENQLKEFEIVATMYPVGPTQQYLRTSVKNLEIARSRHPIDSSSRVVMYHLRENRKKVVQDFHANLEYSINYSGTSHHCGISHLIFFKMANATGEGGKTISPVINIMRVSFENSIDLIINERFLDYLFAAREVEPDHFRLVNELHYSDNKIEYVFEQQVQDENIESSVSLSNSNSDYLRGFQMSVVRVYEQKMMRRRRIDGDPSRSKGPRIRSSASALKRIILLVLSPDRKTKLAEIRFNLVRQIHTLSFAERAKLFDLSACKDLDQESIQISAFYPADYKLVEFAQNDQQNLIDRFYGTALDWLSDAADQNCQDSVALMKRNLALNFNWLRVPKVELIGHLETSEPELELKLTMLEKVSPLDQFESLARTAFEIVRQESSGEDSETEKVDGDDYVLMITFSPAECAEFCRHPMRCKMFSWAIDTRECKLTHFLPILDDKAPQSAQERNASFAKLTLQAFTTVYYEPEHLRGHTYEETTLAQLYSFIDKEANYIDEAELSLESDGQKSLGEEDDDGASSTRHKRTTQAVTERLLSFYFVDRSNLPNEYAPPKLRVLEPSALSIRRMPMTMDVNSIGDDMMRAQVVKTFEFKSAGKCYHLNALDRASDKASAVTSLPARESAASTQRTFIDDQNEIYYTLLKLTSMSQDECALICYNHNEWNAQTAGEQVCVSFSYSEYGNICHLAIRTDKRFVSSVQDIIDEGEQILPIQSLDELEVEDNACFIAKRNFLANFEGPLKLGPDFYGRQTTSETLDEYDEYGLRYNWLADFATEMPAKDRRDQRSRCAERCARRALIDKGYIRSLCLGFDYVSYVELMRVKERVAKTSCNLLLVDVKVAADTKKVAAGLRSLRGQLASLDRKAKPTNKKSTKKYLLPDCDRYIMSHLREFSHVPRSQLTQLNATAAGGLSLTPISETVTRFNLDSCATECFLRREQCVLFQFRLVRKSDKIERQCTLFKISRSSNSRSINEVMDGQQVEFDTDGVIKMTLYNSDCDLYLRREFKSVQDLFSHYSRYSNTSFTHGSLVMVFSVIYIFWCIGIVLYILRKRDISVGQRRQTLVSQANEHISRTT